MQTTNPTQFGLKILMISIQIYLAARENEMIGMHFTRNQNKKTNKNYGLAS